VRWPQSPELTTPCFFRITEQPPEPVSKLQHVYQVFPIHSRAAASPHQRRLHGDDIPSVARISNAPSTTLPTATKLPAL